MMRQGRKTRPVTWIISITAALLLSVICTCFAEEEPGVIRFNGFRIGENIVMDDYAHLRSHYFPSGCVSRTRYSIAKFNAPPEPGRGYEPVYPLPDDVYILSSSMSIFELNRLPEIDIGSAYSPLFAIDPTLALDSSIEECPLVIHLFPGIDVKEILSVIRKIPVVEIQGETANRIGLKCPWDGVTEAVRVLSSLEGIFYIERDRGVRLFNNQAVPILQSGTIPGTNAIFQQGIFGEGQVAAVCDTGIDADSCFFRDSSGLLPPTNDTTGTTTDPTRRKVIAVDFLYSGDNPLVAGDWDDQGHGTSVSGSALGSNISDPTGSSAANGMAPLAKLIMQDAGFAFDNCADLPGLGCPVIDLTPVFQQAYNQGARVHSNSWGDRENFFPHNTYTGRCQDVDDFTWNNKDFLIVCAAGNDGQATGAVASPGVAKNALSVGGTMNGVNADAIISFSSRGPASDGRIKPDLVAPANVTTAQSDFNITSNNCSTTGIMGTSLSTPLVAGAACLVREYFQDGFYPGGIAGAGAPINPSAALVKAVLINSCVNVATASPIPANDQGWGRVALDEAMYFPGENRSLFVHDESTGFADADAAPYEAHFEVLSASEPLKITLVWSDYPATLGAEPQLVNDLNLNVVMDGDAYRGNGFSSGVSVPGGSFDALNNVEQVLIEAPATGNFTVQVLPATVTEGPQDFALVITGAFREAESSSTINWQVY